MTKFLGELRPVAPRGELLKLACEPETSMKGLLCPTLP
jgi:hypothetical protein